MLERFPQAEIDFAPVDVRQRIVDSWPGDVDDQNARQDWGLETRHGLDQAFDDYLIPALERRYGRDG